MADRTNDERLREITVIAARERARVEEIKRLRAERDAARADLREAMELLRAHGQPPDWLKLGDAADWNTRYGKLLAKHKEATDG